MLAKMAKIGLVPVQALRHDQARSGRAGGAEGPAASGLKQIEANKKSLGKMVNGWLITKGLGVYGTDYMKRAVVAAFGWPANLQEDAVYPYTDVDSAGEKLTGANKYTLTFAEGRDAAGQWLLVDHDVHDRRRLVVRAQPAQQVHRQPAQQAEVQRRRLADAVLPERIAGQGQGSQLAAGAEGRIHPDDANVLAEGEESVGARRHLGAAGRS